MLFMIRRVSAMVLLVMLIAGCGEQSALMTQPSSDKEWDDSSASLPVIKVQDGVTSDTANILIRRLPARVREQAAVAVVGRAPSEQGKLFLVAICSTDKANVSSLRLYSLGLGEKSARHELTIEEDGHGWVSFYSPARELVAQVHDGIVLASDGAKRLLKALCAAAVWLAGSLVCTALSFWSVPAAIICGAIHAFIGYFC